MIDYEKFQDRLWQAREPVQGKMRPTDGRSTVQAPSTLVPNQSTHFPMAYRNSL